MQQGQSRQLGMKAAEGEQVAKVAFIYQPAVIKENKVWSFKKAQVNFVMYPEKFAAET